MIALVAFERKVTWLGNKNEGAFFVKWFFWILNCGTMLTIESISQEESLTVSMLMHLTDCKNNRNNSRRVRGLLCHVLSWLCGCPWTQDAVLFSLHATGREGSSTRPYRGSWQWGVQYLLSVEHAPLFHKISARHLALPHTATRVNLSW